MFYGMYGEQDDNAPTVVSRYRVRYYAGLDLIDVVVLAESEQQCRDYVTKTHAIEERMQDYPEGRKDSLQVLLLSREVLPYVLTDQ